MTPQAPSSDAPASEWLVYADALQHQGAPLGELIVVMHAGDVEKKAACLSRHATAILGAGAAKHFSDKVLTLEWRWGFLERATVRASSAAVLEDAVGALLASPVAARLASLSLVAVPESDDAVLDASGAVSRALERAPATLTRLELIDDRAATASSLTSRDFDPGNNLVNFGPLDPLWRSPSLRSLELVIADVQQLEPGTIDAPKLESLAIRCLRFASQAYGEANPSELATALGAAKLPSLKSFSVRLCEEWTVNQLDDTGAYTTFDSYPEDDFDEGYSEGADWPGEFGAALGNLVRSPLERLALTNFASTESLLGLIASTGLPATLRVLDLSESSLSSADLPWFTQHKTLLSRLERLVVNHTGFTDEDARALRGVVANVEHSTAPGRAGPEDEEGESEEEAPGERPLPKYRYIVGME